MTLRRFLPISAVAAAMLTLTAFAAPVLAEAPGGERRPGEIVRERVEQALRSLEKFVAELPSYGMPEITAEGDIVIPRKNPSPDLPANNSPESDSADI